MWLWACVHDCLHACVSVRGLQQFCDVEFSDSGSHSDKELDFVFC